MRTAAGRGSPRLSASMRPISSRKAARSDGAELSCAAARLRRATVSADTAGSGTGAEPGRSSGGGGARRPAVPRGAAVGEAVMAPRVGGLEAAGAEGESAPGAEVAEGEPALDWAGVAEGEPGLDGVSETGAAEGELALGWAAAAGAAGGGPAMGEGSGANPTARAEATPSRAAPWPGVLGAWPGNPIAGVGSAASTRGVDGRPGAWTRPRA